MDALLNCTDKLFTVWVNPAVGGVFGGGAVVVTTWLTSSVSPSSSVTVNVTV